MLVFQLRHRSSNVNSCSLDVVRRRGAHVRVSEDSLNHHIRHTEMVQVASQSAPRRVPPVLLWQARVILGQIGATSTQVVPGVTPSLDFDPASLV